MAEYIEREAAKESFLNMDAGSRAPCSTLLTPEEFAEYLDEIPAADVAPVVHGRWEMRPTGMATDTGPEYKAYCTVCNEPNKQYQPPYCPHCGAKMEGGAENAAD